MSINLYGENQNVSIDSFGVYLYVIENIDFELPFDLWLPIDSAFSTVWNDKLGLGGYFYWDEVPEMVSEEIIKEHKLIPYDIVSKVTLLILEYIEKSGGFLT